jgi:hypothetical protein
MSFQSIQQKWLELLEQAAKTEEEERDKEEEKEEQDEEEERCVGVNIEERLSLVDCGDGNGSSSTSGSALPDRSPTRSPQPALRRDLRRRGRSLTRVAPEDPISGPSSHTSPRAKRARPAPTTDRTTRQTPSQSRRTQARTEDDVSLLLHVQPTSLIPQPISYRAPSSVGLSFRLRLGDGCDDGNTFVIAALRLVQEVEVTSRYDDWLLRLATGVNIARRLVDRKTLRAARTRRTAPPPLSIAALASQLSISLPQCQKYVALGHTCFTHPTLPLLAVTGSLVLPSWTSVRHLFTKDGSKLKKASAAWKDMWSRKKEQGGGEAVCRDLLDKVVQEEDSGAQSSVRLARALDDLLKDTASRRFIMVQ